MLPHHLTAPRRTTTASPPGALRVTGTLTHDAVVRQGTRGHCWLDLHFAPPSGMSYMAMVDLGADLADHMAAEALLVLLRRGAVVTVAADGGLLLRTEHHQSMLALQEPHSVVVLEGAPALATREAHS